ncbi:hypothetical protein HEK616_33250 [Streptomyces nigrescens]|uniref:Uncharacterized protein n=1 Tax=Streptomyces nigrescens TaxID=1920 RepID=A0ABM7ZTY4_STRNI|nr:hypothetical protein HEK616_33250 [Streptomyces nigrescens]
MVGATWVRLWELLRNQGLDPARTIVVDLLQEGPDHEDGQVISDDNRGYTFSLVYDQAAEHGARSAYLDNCCSFRHEQLFLTCGIPRAQGSAALRPGVTELPGELW